MSELKKPKKWLHFLLGLVFGIVGAILTLVIGKITCGREPGEIPPFAILIMTLWLLQWGYLVPAMIVGAIMRKWWFLWGVFASGLLIGIASGGFFILMAANPSTV